MSTKKHLRANEMKENDITIDRTSKQNDIAFPRKKVRLSLFSTHVSRIIELNNMAVDIYELGKAHDDYTDILALELLELATEYFESLPDGSKFVPQSVLGSRCANDRYEKYESLTEQWKGKIFALTGEAREKANSVHCNEFSHITTKETLEYELFCDVQVDGGPQIFANALRLKENVTDCSADADHHAVALYNMGLVQHRNGKDESCMNSFRRALSALDIILPTSPLDCLEDNIDTSTSNPLVMIILNNIGQLEFFQGEHLDAFKIFSHSLRIGKELVQNASSESCIQEPRLRDLHRCVGIILSNIARVHFQIGGIYQAIQVSKEMLRTKRKAFGHYHLGFAVALYNCGILCFKGEDHKEALQYFRAFVQVATKNCGNDRRFIVSALNKIILVEYEMGMHNNTLRSWHEMLSEKIDELDFDHPCVSRIIDRIASLHSQYNDQEIALEFYRERLRVQTFVLNDDNITMAQTLAKIGQTYQNLDLGQEAIQYYCKAAYLMKHQSSSD